MKFGNITKQLLLFLAEEESDKKIKKKSQKNEKISKK